MSGSQERKYRYVFGPVPSRRLGRSLGVDLLTEKVCSFNCIYCQVGETSLRTIERKEWVPTNKVIEEIQAKLESGTEPDFITFSGSGEPTLHSRIGDIINWIKDNTSHKVAVLTNSSLLWMREVREELARADVVVPSLDAADEDTFKKINQPAEGLSYNRILDGLATFSRSFEGEIWLEILVVEGVNDSPKHFDALEQRAQAISFDRVQVHTVTRPPATSNARPVGPEVLESLAKKLGTTCSIVHPARKMKVVSESVDETDIVSMLSRRPCTVEDIANGLGVNVNEAAKVVGILYETGKLKREVVDDRQYFSLP